MVSMQDVAKKAAVSSATVSRVLNGCASVSETTRKTVFAACEELNYKINPRIQDFVRKSRGGFTRNLALVFVNRDFSDPAYNQILDELAQTLADKNFHMSLVKLSMTISGVYDLPAILRDERVDGILLTGELNRTICDIMAKLRVPTVVMGNYSSQVLGGLSNISVNFPDIISKNIKLAHEHGAIRFAFASENETSYANQIALSNVTETLAEINLPLPPEAIFWSAPLAGVPDKLREAFSLPEFPFDAIFAKDQRMAFELSHLAANRQGREKGFTFQLITLPSWKDYKYSIPVLPLLRPHVREVAEALKLIELHQNGHHATFRVTV